MRTHPLTILLGPIKYIQSQILFIFLLYFISGGDNRFIFLMVIGSLFILIFVNQLIRWLTFKYYIKDDELRIEYGLFVKKRTYISKKRIQSIDLTESLWHRLFSLVKVEVKTAGTQGDSMAIIDAVSRDLGYLLREELQTLEAAEFDEPMDCDTLEQEETTYKKQTKIVPKFRISYKRLFISGLTSGGVGVIIAFSIAGVSQLEGLFPEDTYERIYTYFIQSSVYGIALLVTVVLLLAWIVSVGLTLIRYGNFTIHKEEDELIITYGLIEKKHLTIPFERIQAVGYKQNIVRELFGFGTVYADVAGGTIEDLKASAGTVLFPLLKTREVNHFLKELLPDYEALLTNDLQPLARTAWKSYVFRATILFVPILIATWLYVRSFTWVVLLLMIVSGLFGILRARSGGYSLKENTLIVQHRLFNKERLIIYKRRIQAIDKKQNPFQKHGRMGTLGFANMSGITGRKVRIRQFSETDIDKIAYWFKKR